MKKEKLSERKKEEIDKKVLKHVSKAKGKEKALKLTKLVYAVFGEEAKGKAHLKYEKRVKDSLRRWRARGEHVWIDRGGSVYYPISKEELQRRINKYRAQIKSSKLMITVIEASNPTLSA